MGMSDIITLVLGVGAFVIGSFVGLISYIFNKQIKELNESNDKRREDIRDIYKMMSERKSEEFKNHEYLLTNYYSKEDIKTFFKEK